MSDDLGNPIYIPLDRIQARVAYLLTAPGGLDCEAASHCFEDEKQLAQLRNFRGFITKVMHNGIRKFIPNTLRLLSSFKMELAFFVAVSSSYQTLRAKGPILPDVHLNWFKKVFLDWVAETGSTEAALVEDIFLHELVLHQARTARRAVVKPQAEGALWFDGELVLQRYYFDVLKVLKESNDSDLSISAKNFENPVILAYWLGSSQNHVVTQVDEFTAHVLSMVNDRRNNADITRKFNQGGIAEVNLELINHVVDNLIATTPLQRVGIGQ